MQFNQRLIKAGRGSLMPTGSHGDNNHAMEAFSKRITSPNGKVGYTSSLNSKVHHNALSTHKASKKDTNVSNEKILPGSSMRENRGSIVMLPPSTQNLADIPTY